MTAETASAMAQPDPARSPAAAAASRPPAPAQRTHRRVPRARARTGAEPVRDDPAVVHLATRASNGDSQAWDALVERYAPLIWSICRRYRLGDTGRDLQRSGKHALGRFGLVRLGVWRGWFMASLTSVPVRIQPVVIMVWVGFRWWDCGR